MRRYCWRFGLGVDESDVRPDGRCAECGAQWSTHRGIAAGTCGAFVACKRALGKYGHPCTLAPGHEGDHHCAPCGAAYA